MLYLLDADTLITGDRKAYPLHRFPIFWEWIYHQGIEGKVKIPIEQYEEVTVGNGSIVDWLKEADVRDALVLGEEIDPAIVADTTLNGYGNLNEAEIELVGRDPFLISYGRTDTARRTVVTFEVSSPAKKRANRKIPDVCAAFGVPCCTLFEMIEHLDFTTGWHV